ncbi:DNA-entry nuclease [Paenibacillus sp. H1-7]|nr:DNA-entry nuclease [Paenibacillus sp. H1-7]
MKKISSLLSIVIFIILSVTMYLNQDGLLPPDEDSAAAVTLTFPTDRYPETAQHIRNALQRGKSAICTIDRKGAEDNRKESLKGTPSKPNLDRDEFPMAMCAEGGAGADIAYISPSDNRGAGSWISNQLEKYPNGTKVKIVVK